MVEFLLNLEPGLVKDLEHRPIVNMSHRPEVGNAMIDRQLRQAFQQQRAKPLAMKCIIHGECHFGEVILLFLGEIRARGNNMWTPAAGTANHEAELLTWVGWITERIHPLSSRSGQ